MRGVSAIVGARGLLPGACGARFGHDNRDAAPDLRTCAWGGAHDELAAKRREAVGHPLHAGAVARGVRVEADAVVGDFEDELAVSPGEADRGPGRLCVLG